MRLIDADNIYNVGDSVILHEDGNAYVPLADLCKIIDIQPTAYEVDKVLEQLKEASYERFGNDGMGGELVVNLDDAIEIIKGGGENE